MDDWEYVEKGRFKRGQDELKLTRLRYQSDFTEKLKIDVLVNEEPNRGIMV